MIHYNVWFSLKKDAREQDELNRITRFLTDQKSRSMIHDFKLLRNRASETKLPPFQALILFVNSDQFARPFEEVGAVGARSGAHGSMIANVDIFTAETFEVFGPAAKEYALPMSKDAEDFYCRSLSDRRISHWRKSRK